MLNAALVYAIRERRADYVELLTENGADIHSIPFVNVLLTWEPALIRFLIAHGADILTGSPFAEAFASKVRTAVRPFMECRQAHPEHEAALVEQANQALRYFARKGDLKWVSLMLWAGADPRSRGPEALERTPDDEDCFTTALESVCCCDNLEVVKKLKPDRTLDDLEQMLCTAALFKNKALISYLLDLGANPSDKANGGSSAIDQCISGIPDADWRLLRSGGLVSRHSVSTILECIELLAQRGASWRPNDRRQMDWARRGFYKCEPEVTTDTLKVLLKHKACTDETAMELLNAPRMRDHLAKVQWHVTRLGLKGLAGISQGRSRPPTAGGRGGNLRAIGGVTSALFANVRPVLSGRRKYNREQLYEEVWAEPMLKVALRYGVSDVALAKTCRILNIPLPGRGYWAKKAAGKPVPQRPQLPLWG